MPGKAEDAEIAGFVDEQGVRNFEHVIDPDGSLWSTLEISGQPSFAFINDDGTIERVRGRLGEDTLIERVESLISS